MLSPEGRCKTLDASADGYLRAEACGVLTLLPSQGADTHAAFPASALEQPLALLVGSAVNQDGRSSSLTAPNGPAQQAVIRAALASGSSQVQRHRGGPVGFSPHDLTLLGLHGTGTPLGDPIELGAAASALLQPPPTSSRTTAATTMPLSPSSPPLCLASSKAWTGHAEPAAGVVGLLQAFLSARHCLVAPLLNLRSLNPHLRDTLESAGASGTGGGVPPRGVAMPRQAGPTPVAEGRERFLCGVSAFAYQGTNAHLLCAASPPASTSAPAALGGLAAAMQKAAWDIQRCWVVPPPRALAAGVSVTATPHLLR